MQAINEKVDEISGPVSKLDQVTLLGNGNVVDRIYWEGRLTASEISNYFMDRGSMPSANRSMHSREVRSFVLPAPIKESVNSLSTAPKARHLLLLSVLGIFAQKYAGAPYSIILTVAGDRKSVFPFLLGSVEEKSLVDVLSGEKENFVADWQHSEYPFHKMLRISPQELRHVSCIAMTMDGAGDFAAMDDVEPGIHLDFSCGDTWRLDILYYPDEIGDERIWRIGGLYIDLLTNLLRSPRQRIDTVELINAQEAEQILRQFNATEWPFPERKTIIDLFAEQLDIAPERTAILFEKESLTYRELDVRSNQVANALLSRHIPSYSVIGVYLERSTELMIAIFGILKSGNTYMPLAPGHPQERTLYSLKDSSAAAVITERRHFPLFQDEFSCLDVRETRHQAFGAVSLAIPDGIAYIIYTSGSTGKPKGVMIRHFSLVNRLCWMQRAYGLQPEDRILQKTSIAFDVSIWELFWWSMVGATLVLPEQGVERDPDRLCGVIRERSITVLHFVPSMLNALLLYLETRAAERQKLKSVRHVFASGEELPVSTARAFHAVFYARLHNLYGPTEATVDVSYFEVLPGFVGTRVPIGRPIDNTQLVILNARHQFQPIGVAGELYIGGVNLAAGYINQPGLTAERFIKSQLPGIPMLYKTGDLARWNPDGSIEFLGRIDGQVKIRGFRIETGEIEHVMDTFGGVSKSIVLIKDGASGPHLLAYYIATGVPREDDLREYLGRFLPEYMIPAFFIPIREIPVTINGKVDRSKLLALTLPAPRIKAAPVSDMERDLLRIWKEVLGEENISVVDNFFQIGGDSILGIRLLSSINSFFSVEIPLADIYASPSVRQLAPRVTSLVGEHSHIDPGADEALPVYRPEDLHLVDPSNVEDIYPMSDIQKGMVYHFLHSPDTVEYFERNVIDILGVDFDELVFRTALQRLTDKHEALRTDFELESFVNVVRFNVKPELHIEDISALGTEAQREWLDHYLEASKTRSFDPCSAPLWRMHIIRVGADHRILVIEICHPILDGWSYVSMVTELNTLYTEMLKRPDYIPKPLGISYKDFVLQEIKNKRDPMVRDYWRREVQGFEKLKFPPADTANPEYVMESMTYEQQLLTDIMNFAARHQTNLKHLFFAAYAYAIARITGRGEIMIGLVSFNRPIRKDSEKVLGCFINMIPVRIQLSAEFTWGAYLDAVEAKLTALKRYDKIALLEILSLNSLQGSPDTLFDVQFNFTNFQRLNEFGTKVIENAKQAAVGVKRYLREDTRLDFTIELGESRCTFDSEYATDFIQPENVKLLHRYFDEAVHAMLEQTEEAMNQFVLVRPSRSVDHSGNNSSVTRRAVTLTLFQREVAALWEETLGLESHAITANIDFFEAGGHSIHSIALIAKVRRRYGVDLEVRVIYQTPQLIDFCDRLESELESIVTVHV